MPLIITPAQAAQSRRRSAALVSLYGICLGMDVENTVGKRPTERQYRAAMRMAARALGQPEPTWPGEAKEVTT